MVIEMSWAHQINKKLRFLRTRLKLATLGCEGFSASALFVDAVGIDIEPLSDNIIAAICLQPVLIDRYDMPLSYYVLV
jgi:hypothetical protein